MSTTEHSLQTAWFAQTAGAPEALVVAALLHDIGHLLEEVPEALGEWTTDARHEELGAHWLARRFGPRSPSRCGCTCPPSATCARPTRSYFAHLSPPRSHAHTAGRPDVAAEVARFEREHYWREAVQVRQWDDQGKVAGLVTAPLEAYAQLIERLAC